LGRLILVQNDNGARLGKVSMSGHECRKDEIQEKKKQISRY